ncbi:MULTISPECIES: DEAD/DEAH box helicase [unclassified Facklamia]|uniref:DEAD/DEAH box helicase n=1 Tax=Aerococcaceae TaxID=186827 RepID=UPI0013B79783|nr:MULTISPECIES: DEAD/DEAH box helicase [unclassified Facklamia]NEW64032.1 DEAD/DEAH box helicase [Facklamia sp. 252]NEW68823.1 DEAD/DEAH box helicase [Facklamia sp. 253]QQD65377.1 DEAD/DEAH box helicase [Aerococcaceae bacterium zg-252]
MKFTDLNLRKELLLSLDELGFEEPTPIQQKSVPVTLEGNDLIGQAQTGTGKTAAFGLPMLNKLDNKIKGVQGLVIAPTRELAIQVQEELFRLGKGLRARVYVVYGGSPIGKQIDRLKNNAPQIIVGTPGRILDLIRRRALDLTYLQTLVLDEADEMLNMGFIDDIRSIIEVTPPSRQTLLFSATMPNEIRQLAEQFLHNPTHVKIEAKQMTADLIEQYFIKCRDDEKFDILTRLLDVQMPKQAIVFCRTKKRVDEVGRGLSLRGFNAELIHGDITQQKRTSVINQFRNGEIELLVATDVAARGLDISGVTHVYNYDISQDPESYVHRIGRTGRAGNEGSSMTFVTNNEMPYLRTIETLTRKQMMPMKPPTLKEAQQGQVQQLIDQMNERLKAGSVEHHRNTAKLLLQHYEANDLVTALLGSVINDNTTVEVSISPQKPLPNANKKSRARNNGGTKFNRNSRRDGKRENGREQDSHNKRERFNKKERSKSKGVKHSKKAVINKKFKVKYND